MNNASPTLAGRNASHRYEAQLRLPKQRMCGAATLVMAYRQCRLEVDQSDIWSNIAQEHLGNFRANTYQLAQDAISRGLVASIVQTHRPWEILQTCWQNNLAAVVNHRIQSNSHEGHYSLLAGINQDTVKLNDPLEGPAITYKRDDFLKLWLPAGDDCEISGNVLVVIGRTDEQPAIWSHCNQPFEDSVACLHCKKKFDLMPAMALGCRQLNCTQRMWWRVFCPWCDAAFTG